MKKILLLLLIILVVAGFSGCKDKRPSEISRVESTETDLAFSEELPPAVMPENALELFQQGLAYINEGELENALEKILLAQKLAPNIPAIYLELGNIYFDLKKYNDAVTNYSQAIKLGRELDGDEELARPYVLRGETYQLLRNYNAAIADFTRAIKLVNDNGEEKYVEEQRVLSQRGEVYYFMGNYDLALTDFNQAIQLNRNNSNYWNNRGEIHRNMGNYDLAIDDYIKAVNINPKNTNVINNLGLAYYGKNDYDKAIENFNKVIDIDRFYANAWNNRGCTWIEKGEYDKAIDDFSQLLKLSTKYDFAIAHSNRSRAYLGKNDYKSALDECDRALRVNRNYTPAFSNRGNIYRAMGDYQNSLKAYKDCLDNIRQAVNINDISVYAWYLAGQVYQEFPYLKGEIKTHDFWSQFAGQLALDGIGKGIENAERIRQNMGIYGAGLMSQMIYLYYAGVDFEAKMGSKEKAFYYSEALRSRGFLEQIGTEAAINLNGITDNDRAEFRRLRAVIEEQHAIAKNSDATSLRHTIAVRNRRDAERKLDDLDKRLGRNIEKYTELRKPKPVSLEKAIAYCGNDKAVLEFVIWDENAYRPVKGYESWELKGSSPKINSYCLVITKDGLNVVPLEAGFDYSKTIKELRIA